MATKEICGFQVDTEIISEKEAAQIILDMLVANRKDKKIQCYLDHMARIRKRLAEEPPIQSAAKHAHGNMDFSKDSDRSWNWWVKWVWKACFPVRDSSPPSSTAS